MTYHPFFVDGADRPGAWCVSCDHASNVVPEFVNGGGLGLPEADMARHIAFDPGAAGVARALGEALNCPSVMSNFSRLVIDPNRGLDDPTLLMKLYDGTIIPANRAITETELAERKARCYDPYHAALAKAMARPDVALVSVHSFTQRLNGRTPRPWEIGILHAWDDRLARPVLDLLRAEGDLTVGDNEPYAGHLPGDAVDRHALQAGKLNVLIELRQDVIATPLQQVAWAQRLAPVLETARARLHTPDLAPI